MEATTTTDVTSAWFSLSNGASGVGFTGTRFPDVRIAVAPHQPFAEKIREIRRISQLLPLMTDAQNFVTMTRVALTALIVPVSLSVLGSAGASPNTFIEYTTAQRVFDAVQALYLSPNAARDRQIARRLTTLYRVAVDEDETIRPTSISQFRDFFLAHPGFSLPKITLTPDGTLRSRWIHGEGNFVALEFTGEPNVKLVAEIPREDGLSATHFGSEPLKNVVAVVQGLGASFA